MYTVVAVVEMPRPTADEARWLEDGIVARVRTEDGFVRGFRTHDGHRAYNMIVFTTRAGAEARAADVRGNAANQVAAGLVPVLVNAPT